MIIGITGGIGAGKSVVTDYLRGKGYGVIDADEVARESVMPGEPALSALSAAFGERILNDDGTLDRGRLARMAFADGEATRRLNAITHVDIKRRIRDKVNELREGEVIFVSAPLLHESGLDRIADEIWLVTAPEEVRIARAASRDGVPAEDIRTRVIRQMDEGERKALADVIIENDGDIEDLQCAIERLLAERL
jgi:dephospho-CoA kinase